MPCQLSPYTKKDSPFSKKTGLFSKKTGLFTKKIGLYQRKASPYEKMMICWGYLLQENEDLILLENNKAILT